MRRRRSRRDARGPHDKRSSGNVPIAGDSLPKPDKWDESATPGRRLLHVDEAPSHLRFNPYIRSGYRGYLSPAMCVQSILWWTNETMNIWTQLLGMTVFAVVFTRDITVCIYLGLPIHLLLLMVVLLLAFEVTLLLSVLYHTYNCQSLEAHTTLLALDQLGIVISLGTIFMVTIYHAFICLPQWQTFYMCTTGLLFVATMASILPSLEVRPHIRNLWMAMWLVYAVVPTVHWIQLLGGIEHPLAKLFLPRLGHLYLFVLVASVVYFLKLPERYLAGKVDYIGASHQLWHILVLATLYHCYFTGFMYIQIRVNYVCPNSSL